MEFFERIEQMAHLRPSPLERAAGLLTELADLIAEAPDAVELTPGTYSELYTLRLDRARRAYAKALRAMSGDELEYCIAHAESGLMHFELAQRHARTSQTTLSASQLEVPHFPEGGCEEIMQALGDAICRIKQYVEYKGVFPIKPLRELIAMTVQSLQDAVENYARADHGTALDIAGPALVWSQYIYARLANDTLVPTADQPKRLRLLFNFAQQAGQAGWEPVCEQTEAGLEKVQNLESFLQSALMADLDNDINEMDKFIRLGEIEANALLKTTPKMRRIDRKSESEGAAVADTSDDGKSGAVNKGSFKRITGAIGDLIDRYHPQPHKASVALRELQSNSIALRRAMRGQSWQEASRLIAVCRDENAILVREIGKMTD